MISAWRFGPRRLFPFLFWAPFCFCLYSDGITEAQNPDEEEFGVQRLLEIIRNRRHAGLAILEAAVFSRLKEFQQGLPSTDDRTMLLIRFDPS
ncbi:SpoIIE family protein phosphatase [Acidobacteriota bacterium]